MSVKIVPIIILIVMMVMSILAVGFMAGGSVLSKGDPKICIESDDCKKSKKKKWGLIGAGIAMFLVVIGLGVFVAINYFTPLGDKAMAMFKAKTA
jgi:flagellar basal body-associated protein FliL